MPLIPLLSGVALLISGRRLFWFIIAVLGFIFSYQFAQQHLPNLSQDVLLIVGVALGIGGAILAVFIQKLAIGIAGFLAGGMAGTYIWELLGQSPDAYLVVFLVAGLLGILFMMIIFDWALVVLTSLTGSALLIQAFDLVDHTYGGFIFLGLTFLGIVIQRVHSPPKKRRD